MQWITIILVGIAVNLDNLGISLAYGIKRITIPIISNAVIALLSMAVTYVAITIGETLSDYISVYLANLLGSLLLCIIGTWTLLSQRLAKGNHVKSFDKNHSAILALKDAIILGFILSANCLATGIAIGANDISTIAMVISIGVFSFITIAIGSHFGILLAKSFIGRYSTAIAGWLLIGIGIFEIFA
ncbi:manganese efflux pump [Metasolibacillus sp.]|uniref:manganese efflux pump MntP n=1 Tax=Metasolibacillus sp. TaxID=2703680 RepID=UPI0025E0F4AB|nr:manganese efflux pump [Metasolibacillus sp.]MCT6925820.1 manganese efflux pump [Metasolibacillus sp.]MCT6941928.1 manganese efflux pump [Metasolibacillus sp.]